MTRSHSSFVPGPPDRIQWAPLFADDPLPSNIPMDLDRSTRVMPSRKCYESDADEDMQGDNTMPHDECSSDDIMDEDDNSNTDANSVSCGSKHRMAHPSTDRFKRPRLSSGDTSSIRRQSLPRRVDADLNSDDEIIYSMKERGYKDEAVRDELIRQGRIKYVAKTISTRYGRIKRALEKQETERLDAELSDWHEGDDELLRAAHAEVLPLIDEARAALDAKLWSETATALKRRMSGNPRFSKNACRDRFEALQAGTAEPPLELDPDQDGRLARRAQRELQRSTARARATKNAVLTAEEKATRDDEKERERLEREIKTTQRAKRAAEEKQRRDSIRANRQAEMEAKQAVIDQKEYDKMQKSALTAQERAEKKREAAALKVEKQRERESQAELKKAREAVERAAKAKDKLRAAEEKLKQIESEQNIKDIMQRRMGQALAASRASSSQPGYDGDESSMMSSPSVSFGSQHWHPGPPSSRARSIMTDTYAPHHSRAGSTSAFYGSSAGESPSLRAAETPAPEYPADPRAGLDSASLVGICRQRSISQHGSRRELLARLVNMDRKMNIKDLKELLKERGVSANGSKAELLYRVAAHDAGQIVNPSRVSGKKQISREDSDETLAPAHRKSSKPKVNKPKPKPSKKAVGKGKRVDVGNDSHVDEDGDQSMGESDVEDNDELEAEDTED